MLITNLVGVAAWRTVMHDISPQARIVATNGCFDILHVGHIHMLEKARELGDILVVGLNGDSSVKTLKGPSRPINTERNRAKVLAAIRYVNVVAIFDTERATEFLEAVQPHLYVKSSDYSLETMDKNERKVLEAMGTEIRFIDLIDGISTTNIVKRCNSPSS